MDREKTPLLTEPRTSRSFTSRRGQLLAIAAITATAVLVVVCAPWKATSSPVASSNERLCGTTNDEAGYIHLANCADTHYFYWFFEAQHAPETAPLVVWLTGGPGGSSLFSLLEENGPCRVVPGSLTAEVNAYAWNRRANMIWLDQPTGVGFSYGTDRDSANNSTHVGENVYWFIQGFLDKHPEFVGRAFFVTGDSFAGHYIPSVAYFIHQQNQRNATDRRRINLRGIAIGNAWTDPLTQIKHAIDMVHNNDYNLTLLTPSETEQLQRDIDECLVALPAACLPVPAANRTLCEQVDGECYKKIFRSIETHGNRNRFDIRRACDGNSSGTPDTEAFLNQPHVRAYLRVDDTRVSRWEITSQAVAFAIISNGGDTVSVSSLVAELLDAGLRVLIYVGDADFDCSWQGNLAWLQGLAWRGHDGFEAAIDKPFLSRDPLKPNEEAQEKIPAGTVRAFENLTFLKVRNAGHMVPTQQPVVALDLINRFFSDASFEYEAKRHPTER